MKTPEILEIEVFLRAIVRAVDSSLIDEWDRMHRTANEDARTAPGEGPAPYEEPDITKDEHGFTVLVRNGLLQLLRALGRKDWSAAAEKAGGTELATVWDASRFEREFAPFFLEHASIRLDAPARAPANLRMDKTDPQYWKVTQVICDEENDNDWAISCSIDVRASALVGRPVIVMADILR
jgi:hypothetical protein